MLTGLASLAHLQLEILPAGKVQNAPRCPFPAREKKLLFLPPHYAAAAVIVLTLHYSESREGREVFQAASLPVSLCCPTRPCSSNTIWYLDVGKRSFRYRPSGITECLGLEGTSVGHPAQPPAQAGSPRAGCAAPRPGRSGISPEKETPQPPWAAWARAPSPSDRKSSSSFSDRTSSASVCAHCPLSCHWAPLERVWSRPPDPHPADIYKHF